MYGLISYKIMFFPILMYGVILYELSKSRTSTL